MLLQGIYTNYHVLSTRRPAGRLHNESPFVTDKIRKKSDVMMTRNITPPLRFVSSQTLRRRLHPTP